MIDFKRWLIEENDDKDLIFEDLRDVFELDLLEYFFALIERSFKQTPILCNTDGELLQFSKSRFKLSISPEEALRMLLPLTLSKDSQEFLNEATLDKAGKIKKLEFPWLKKGNKQNKSWDNTVMGHITIEQDKLSLETNSENRTQKGKKLLSKYLGEFIVFQQTLIESPEQKLKSSDKTSIKSKKNVDPNELPEIKEQIKAMAKAHWENWLNLPIPALDNETPKEAARTKLGRERLEALLLQFERHNLDMDDNLFKADINYLKGELGLD